MPFGWRKKERGGGRWKRPAPRRRYMCVHGDTQVGPARRQLRAGLEAAGITVEALRASVCWGNLPRTPVQSLLRPSCSWHRGGIEAAIPTGFRNAGSINYGCRLIELESKRPHRGCRCQPDCVLGTDLHTVSAVDADPKVDVEADRILSTLGGGARSHNRMHFAGRLSREHARHNGGSLRPGVSRCRSGIAPRVAWALRYGR